MTHLPVRSLQTPKGAAPGLRRILSSSGVALGTLPNGCVHALEHEDAQGRIMISQVEGSPLAGGIGRLYLRLGGPGGRIVQAVGPGARVRVGATDDRAVWAGKAEGVGHRTTLWLHPREKLWAWRVALRNAGAAPVTVDALLVQDLGLGERGFVMGNEAYASQYIDHHIERHHRFGPVVMCRQNLGQRGRHPWVAHGCLEGAASFGTDAMQLFGPAFRDAAEIAADAELPSRRLQHEAACAMLRSAAVRLEPGEAHSLTFFGLLEPDHPTASGEDDLARLEGIEALVGEMAEAMPALAEPARSLLQDAVPAPARPLDPAEIEALYPKRLHEERADGRMLSFFVPDGPHNRHVVLEAKEKEVTRRHGTILKSGATLLPDETTLSVTCWMHGVLAAQLTIGNTAFHKLFSVSRDPYNLTRASGLRMLVDLDRAWHLLTVPSAFEMGLSDCRWVYLLGERTLSVRVAASGENPALTLEVQVEGPPCRVLLLGHLVLGERELEQAGRIEIDGERKRIEFRPDPDWLWGQRHPHAVYHLVTATPEAVEAVGGDELLYVDAQARDGAHVAMLSRPMNQLQLAIVGAMDDPEEAERLAQRHAVPTTESGAGAAARAWSTITRDISLAGQDADVQALDTLLPWLIHDAVIHLAVPHGLEQYTGAAWGTRDVCQGPVELLLALRHDAPVKEILRTVLAQQYEKSGDWPQWFMLEPYSVIQDRHSHGDVILWPLKALCDYLESTDDLLFLDEPVAWRDEDSLERTSRTSPVVAHMEKLLATVRERLIPGTHLLRYGLGDWNDSLQPADPAMRDRLVSSWTVALLYQQLGRYARLLERAGRSREARELGTLEVAVREDFHRYLMRDGVVAGYALFEPGRDGHELLLHPSDGRTGLSYSLLPMNRAIIAGLFSDEEARRHLEVIRRHLLDPDGARLMDRPPTYRGGVETFFKRAESAAFFGREIGLMYVHEHLRYAEAMAVLGEARAMWEAMQLVSPIAVTQKLTNAGRRQRNTYFSSSDAAFADRYAASAEWDRVRQGTIEVEGGWRIYSSGPGLFVRLLLDIALGLRRQHGQPVAGPVLPARLGPVTLAMTIEGRRRKWELHGA